MALAERKGCTIEDIYALPDGVRAELIDGRIYYMAPSTAAHQRILLSMATQINNYITQNNSECEAFPAPFAVYLNGDDVNYVEPDISVICDKDKIKESGCKGAPDWVIEIVSPTSRRMDYYTKLFKYRSAMVKEYWVVDYEKKMVSVDDYIVKPFSLKELDARIIAHLKREERRKVKSKYRFMGELSIDYAAKTVQIGKACLELTKLEYEIIEFLSMNPGMVFDKERIYERVCGFDVEGDSRVITELVRRIRKKFSGRKRNI